MSSVCHHALVSTPSLGDTGRHRHRAACVHAVQAAAGPRGSSNGTPAATPSMQQPAQLWPQAPPTAAQPQPIQTQRGIPTFKPVIPDSPCAECAGLGRVTCGECRGKGRLNYRGSSMLPQGVWPEWCPSCRASGRWCCAKCMGTGVRRQPIGFRVPSEEAPRGERGGNDEASGGASANGSGG